MSKVFKQPSWCVREERFQYPTSFSVGRVFSSFQEMQRALQDEFKDRDLPYKIGLYDTKYLPRSDKWKTLVMTCCICRMSKVTVVNTGENVQVTALTNDHVHGPEQLSMLTQEEEEAEEKKKRKMLEKTTKAKKQFALRSQISDKRTIRKRPPVIERDPFEELSLTVRLGPFKEKIQQAQQAIETEQKKEQPVQPKIETPIVLEPVLPVQEGTLVEFDPVHFWMLQESLWRLEFETFVHWEGDFFLRYPKYMVCISGSMKNAYLRSKGPAISFHILPEQLRTKAPNEEADRYKVGIFTVNSPDCELVGIAFFLEVGVDILSNIFRQFIRMVSIMPSSITTADIQPLVKAVEEIVLKNVYTGMVVFSKEATIPERFRTLAGGFTLNKLLEHLQIIEIRSFLYIFGPEPEPEQVNSYKEQVALKPAVN